MRKSALGQLKGEQASRVVCGGNTSCPELFAALALPAAEWTRARFLKAALRTVQ